MKVFIQVGDKKLPLRTCHRMLIRGKYVCAADDVFDLGFSVKDIENNPVTLFIDDLEIELKC